jgi:capsular exopolysaccharide synthesis family protein
MNLPNNSSTLSQASDESDAVFDLKELWYVVQRHLYGVVGFAVVLTGVIVLFLFSMQPVYLAEATLLIESEEAKVVSIEDVYEMGTGRREYYATQFEILKSRELAGKVVQQNIHFFEVQKDEGSFISNILGGFLPADGKTDDELFQARIDWFKRNVTVNPVRSTQLVKVGYESRDPEAAAVLANELARIYIENNLEARLAMTQMAANWLSGRIEGLKERLEESERKLQAYRESQDLVETEGVKALAVKELNEITSRLVEAKRARSEAQNIVRQINNLSKTNAEELEALPAVLEHSLVQRFKEQEANAQQKLSELSKRYGYKHPKIVAAKSDLRAAKSSTLEQIKKVVKGVNKEYEVALATERSLASQLEMVKKDVQGINRQSYKLNELEREVMVNRQLYDTFLSRIKETAEAGGMQAAHARVVDPAVVPTVPVRPKKGLLSALAFIGSLLIGVCIAFLREKLDSTIKNGEDVYNKLHTQMLGVLPFIKGEVITGKMSLAYSSGNRGAFSESIRTIRTGVVLSGLDNPHKILVVTSSIPGEGKTTLSSNLSSAFGQMGRVLLIDADLRRPSIASNFGLKLSSPGLSNLVAETATPKECIHHIKEAGIDVMPSGVIPPNPLELLSSKRFAAVLSGLEKHYDRIIIDTAPVQVVSDALILSTFASAVLYVIKADSTDLKIARSGVARLKEANAPITGVVLNQVVVDKKKAYGYGSKYYYGGYYDYYGYSGEEPPAEKS